MNNITEKAPDASFVGLISLDNLWSSSLTCLHCGSDARGQNERTKVMKKLIVASLAALLVVFSGADAQTLSQADLDRGLQYLETTKKNIADATRGLSEAQWNFKPSIFKWSVAQVMEHIAASEDLLRQMAEGQI
jgi:hypothetical protein